MEKLFTSQPPPPPDTSRSYNARKNSRRMSPIARSHLKHVHVTLCCLLVASAVGAYLHKLLNIGGFLSIFGCVVGTAVLYSTPLYKEKTRFGISMATSLLEGVSFGLLIELAIDIDPSILVTALIGAALAFWCFAGAATVTKRRGFLCFIGLLSSVFLVLLWLQIAAYTFGHSTSNFKNEVYFGLFVFLGYMVFDTHRIVKRAQDGDLDYLKHALTWPFHRSPRSSCENLPRHHSVPH